MTKFKKVIASIIVFCLVIGTITATATPKGVVYESEETNYSATKITHQNAGLGQADGLVDLNGEAERGQSYAWSAVGYGDYVYVGTCYAAIWTTIQMMADMYKLPLDILKSALNVAFNGKLYLGDEKNNPNNINHSVIVRINTETGETKILNESTKEAEHGGYRCATEFNDKLYFCSTAPEILEIDPNNDDFVQSVYKFETPDDSMVSVGIRGITVCNNQLVVSAIGNDGAYIMASSNPSEKEESFKVIATQEDLLDYPAYHYDDAIFGGSIFDMVSFNDKLYVTIVAGKKDHETGVVPKKGFALLEGTQKENGEWEFTVICGDQEKDNAKYPFGFGGDRANAANMVVYDDHLYVGGYNDPMIAIPQALVFQNYKDIYEDLTQPVSLWRMDKDGNWELVVGEPDGVNFTERVGNMGEGFDNHMNQYVWRMQSYNDKLYIGTFDITSLLRPLAQLCNGDIINNTKEDWKDQIKYVGELLETIKDLIKGSGKEAQVLSENGMQTDLESLYDTMVEMESLINKNCLDDIDSLEDFHNLLNQAVKDYETVKYKYNKIKYLLLPRVRHNMDINFWGLDHILNQETVDRFFYFFGTCVYLSKSEEGFDLLVTDDGKNFEAISRDGFGDKFNHGIRTFAVNDDGLFLGTANPFYGAQIWKVQDLDMQELEPGMSELEPGMVDYTGHPAIAELQPGMSEIKPGEAVEDNSANDETNNEDANENGHIEDDAAQVTAFDIPNTGASKASALATLGVVTAAGLGVAFVVKKRKLF